MPAAWREPAEGEAQGPRPPSIREPSLPPPAVRTPKPPQMAPPRYAVPPPPVLRPTIPPFAQQFPPHAQQRPMAQPMTAVVAAQQRPVSSIPYPGLPASAPPAGYTSAGVPGETHPVTGEPMSDRSSLTAGLLQIFLGIFGAGRLYTGHVAIALLQLTSGWLLFAFTMCAGIGLESASVWALFWVGLAWPVIDGIVMLGFGGKDSKGRRLR